MSIDGYPLYLKCWDSAGTLYRSPGCDSLEILERRFATRLYVLDKCKRRHLGDTAEGKLSLGLQVDFESPSISFWAGPSSEIENAKLIGTCARRELAGLPIGEIDHRFVKYRLFYTVVFRDPEQVRKERERKLSRGRTVDVAKDHVRVRQTPEDGYVMGKVSTGTRVILLRRDGQWCHVITPSNKEGWMICDALI